MNDAHAQAVLAAFLGMREILREFDPQAQEDALRKTQAYGVGTRKPSLQQSGAHKGGPQAFRRRLAWLPCASVRTPLATRSGLMPCEGRVSR